MADEMVLKDTVQPFMLVKNIDTLTTRQFNQTVYVRDLGSHIDSVTVSIDKKNTKLTNCTAEEDSVIVNCMVSVSNLTDGPHTLAYMAKDRAGNKTTLSQTIFIRATKINLDVNGFKNALIGESESFVFTATISDAVPAPQKINWSWKSDNGTVTKTADVDEDGKATLTYTYATDLTTYESESYVYSITAEKELTITLSDGTQHH